MNIIYKKVDELIPYVNNPRNNDHAVDYVASSIKNFGFKVPIVVDADNEIVTGHTRLKAAKKLGLTEVLVIIADDLTPEQVRAFRLADNKVAEFSTWDMELLMSELDTINDIDMDTMGFDELEYSDVAMEAQEDDYEIEVPAEPKSKRGEIYQLGRHRLMCGDSTSVEDVERLMDGNLAQLCFTDPPYGMKKEGEGIANDNLNFDDLLEFNKKWIPLSFRFLIDVGSWYCWGIDEPLMDIYSEILKPMAKKNELTFRNLITWNKGGGQGQMNSDLMMYAIADEKCLFVMKGVQGSNVNSDNYFEAWEPIRKYLYDSRAAMGWDVPTMKKIVGHSDLSRDHWTSKSQWSLIPEYAYEKLQNAAEEQRMREGVDNDAFLKEYAELKREYYSSRAFFNNIHDNMTNVWNFPRTSAEERETAGGHVTPKPIALCERAIKSSSEEGSIVLDLFGGSGTTLIACEQLNRFCYMMEYEPKYVDVIINRWENLTGNKAVKIE